jgi:hypothetical protein
MQITTFLFDMGLPMIFPAMYLMILALGPIIFIEAYAIRSLKLTLERTVLSVTVANFVSTIVGIPVSWGLLYLLQSATRLAGTTQTGSFWDIFLAVTVQSPWVHPRGPEYDWIVYAAGLFLLVPFFFASWLLEYWVIVKFVKPTLPAGTAPDELLAKIKRAVRNANLYSYALLALFISILLVIRIARTA